MRHVRSTHTTCTLAATRFCEAYAASAKHSARRFVRTALFHCRRREHPAVLLYASSTLLGPGSGVRTWLMAAVSRSDCLTLVTSDNRM